MKLKEIDGKRIAFSLIGDVLIALAVALAKIAALGSDPFNGMCLSVSAYFNWKYIIFNYACNLVLFAVEFIWGRRYIQIGTIVNFLGVGYFADLFMKLYYMTFPETDSLLVRVPFLMAAVLSMAFGAALYQEANWGIAPYDALPIIIHDYFPKIPYFWCRMMEDGLSVLGMALTITATSRFLGVGSVVFAFCMGPIIHLFTKLLSKKGKTGHSCQL